MLDQQHLAQYLQQLQQKNNVGNGTVALPAQSPSQPLQPSQQQAQQQQPQSGGFSLSGFLGGLGDTQNAQGGYDPSMLSRISQILNGQQQQLLPWQQPQSQQSGQGMASVLSNLLPSLLR